MRVMIVDDEEYIAEELSDALDFLGLQTFSVHSADQALEGLRKETNIDWVITDLRMPNKSGEILISEVNETIGREINFIVMSGHGGDEFTQEKLKSSFPNVVDFVRKPVSFDTLQELVTKTLKAG